MTENRNNVQLKELALNRTMPF